MMYICTPTIKVNHRQAKVEDGVVARYNFNVLHIDGSNHAKNNKKLNILRDKRRISLGDISHQSIEFERKRTQ